MDANKSKQEKPAPKFNSNNLVKRLRFLLVSQAMFDYFSPNWGLLEPGCVGDIGYVFIAIGDIGPCGIETTTLGGDIVGLGPVLVTESKQNHDT